MKYIHIIILITTLILLQLSGTNLPIPENRTPRVEGRFMEYRLPTRSTISVSANNIITDTFNDVAASSEPYGLHYDHDENSWTLYATVLQLRKTSVYGRPGEIAQIEYSLDGEINRNGWIALRIDDYSFIYEESKVGDINVGQDLGLYIIGDYVSAKGVDWERCPRDNIYCMNASFVEGGFPKSEDYGGLTLCPSNTIIHTGFVPNDWINGMLAWEVRIQTEQH